MRSVEVTEFGRIHALALDKDQRDGLLTCLGDLEITPETGAEDLWCLRAGSHVGTIVVPGLTIRIRPKLNIARLFVMLSAASEKIRWNERPVGLTHASAIEDVVASALADSIQNGLATGLLRGYVKAEEESFVVRGRLDLAETLRRRPATLLPLVQNPEFLDENIAENRILATALSVLLARDCSPTVRGRIVDCQRAFAGVSGLPARTELPRIRRNRLNAGWWGSIELSLLVLRSAGLDLSGGKHSSRSFLVDMNEVFERFVFRALAVELKQRGLHLQKKGDGLYLDVDEHHRLVPDLSLWSGSRCVFAGDCKYKYAAEGIPRREDIYQCLAYAAASGLQSVSLIYGEGTKLARDIAIVDGRTSVRVRTLDLSLPAEDLRSQFSRLAVEICGAIR